VSLMCQSKTHYGQAWLWGPDGLGCEPEWDWDRGLFSEVISDKGCMGLVSCTGPRCEHIFTPGTAWLEGLSVWVDTSV
jgi:hypothetical protein